MNDNNTIIIINSIMCGVREFFYNAKPNSIISERMGKRVLLYFGQLIFQIIFKTGA